MVHNHRGLPICCCLFRPRIAKLTSGETAEPLLGEETCMSLLSVEVGVTQVPFGKEQEAQEPSHPSPLPGLLHLDALMTLTKIT